MKRICKIHDEEAGERRPAVTIDREFGPVCAECAREIGQDRGFASRDSSAYAYACGYKD